MFAWRAIRQRAPMTKFAVVRRDPDEVTKSLDWFGLTGHGDEMRARDALLDEIAAQPETLSLSFDDLATPQGCAALYQHCLQLPMPPLWWRNLDPINIQVDMRRQMQMLSNHAGEIAAFRADCERAVASL